MNTYDQNPNFIDVSSLGFDIKQRRQELGLTMVSLARECGISMSTMRLWENGITKQISKSNMEKLKTALKMDGGNDAKEE